MNKILPQNSNIEMTTIDKGSERIEIASSATEIEREWLFEYLKSSYRLS